MRPLVVLRNSTRVVAIYDGFMVMHQAAKRPVRIKIEKVRIRKRRDGIDIFVKDGRDGWLWLMAVTRIAFELAEKDGDYFRTTARPPLIPQEECECWIREDLYYSALAEEVFG